MALRLRASALVGLSWNSDATRQIWSEASDGTVSVSRPVAREERAGCTCLLGGSLQAKFGEWQCGEGVRR